MNTAFRVAAILAAALSPPALPAFAIELGMPVDCVIGETCMIQNYVDADPDGRSRDHECGPLAYDGHQGTDFRLLNRAEIAKGYSVLATAPGIVAQVIDGQPDHGFEGAADNPLGCGNAVMIDHGAGWVSQYCHLAQGSVSVRRGQSVPEGAPLGRIGSSGGTDFPHLHYAIRRFGVTLDPFTGVSPTGCEAPDAAPLWKASTGLGYIPSALVGVGITGVFPSLETVKRDHALLTPPAGSSAPVYLWMHMLGVRAGDSARLMIFDPDGRPVASELFEVEEDQTIYLANIGIAPSDMGQRTWPPGDYAARAVFYANGEEATREDLTFTLP